MRIINQITENCHRNQPFHWFDRTEQLQTPIDAYENYKIHRRYRWCNRYFSLFNALKCVCIPMFVCLPFNGGWINLSIFIFNFTFILILFALLIHSVRTNKFTGDVSDLHFLHVVYNFHSTHLLTEIHNRLCAHRTARIWFHHLMCCASWVVVWSMVNYRCALRAHRFSEFNKFAIHIDDGSVRRRYAKKAQKQKWNEMKWNETERRRKNERNDKIGIFKHTKRQAHIQSRSKHDGSSVRACHEFFIYLRFRGLSVCIIDEDSTQHSDTQRIN